MANVREIKGKRGTRFEVRVRLKGFKTSRVFRTKAEADSYGMRMEADILCDKYVEHDLLGDITMRAFLERYDKETTPSKRGARQEHGRIRQLLKHPLAGTEQSDRSKGPIFPLCV